MALGIDPTVDYVFKKLFGDPANSDLLIHLLNAVLKPVSPIVEVEILNPFNDKDFAEDKLSILDIKARDARRAWFNIEMQGSAPELLRQRLPYYNASLYVDQLLEGHKYEALLPAISICFLKGNLFSEVSVPHLQFTLCDNRHGVQLTDRLQIHTIELAKYNFNELLARQSGLAQTADPLEQWAFFLCRAAEFEVTELQQLLPDPAYQKATGVVEMIAHTPEERMKYEARRKAELDFNSFLAEAQRTSLAEGIEKGRREGLLEGRKEGLVDQIRAFQLLLNEPVSPAADLLVKDFESLSQLCEQLKARLSLPKL